MAIVINGSGTVTGLAVGGLPDGTVDSDTLASGIDKTSISDSGDATTITIDSSENVGIKVTPKNWNAAYNGVLEIGDGHILSHNDVGDGIELGANFYNDGTGFKRKSANEATRMYMSDGTYGFQVTPNDAADSAITWTTALEIINDGRGLSQFTALGWILFDGTGTVSIRDSYNVSSISDQAVGAYTINFSNAVSNTNYSVATSSKYTASGNAEVFNPHVRDTTDFTAMASNDTALQDIDNLSAIWFGDG